MEMIQDSEICSDDISDVTELLFQSTDNLMLFLDRSGKILRMNNAGILFSGFKEEEYIGKRFWTIPGVFSKDNLSGYLTLFKNSLLGKKTECFIATLYDKSGKTLTMDFSTYPIIEDGSISRILVVGKDISDIEESEQRYQLIAENTSDLIAITTLSLNPTYTYLSPSTERIMGYRCADIIGTYCLDLIHPDDKKILLGLLTKYVRYKGKKYLLNTKETFSESFEYRLQDKNGTWRLLESTADVLGDEILIVSKDITEKKKTEETLRKNEKFLSDVLNSIDDEIYIVDTDFKIVQHNRKVEEEFKQESQIIGKNCYKVYQHRDDPCPWCPTFRSIETEKTHTAIASFTDHQNKQKWLSISSYPLFDTDGSLSAIIIYNKDVTDLKRIEEELKQNKNFLDNILETTSDGIIVLNTDFQYTYWNKAMEELSLNSREQVVGSKVKAWEIFPHLKENGVDQLMKQAMHGQSVCRIGLPYTIKNGKTGFTTESYFPSYDNQGNIKGIIGVVRDTTKEEETKHEVRYLAEVANNFVTIKDEDTFEYLATTLKHFAGESIVTVNLIKDNTLQIKSIVGVKKRNLSIVNKLMGSHDLYAPVEGVNEEAMSAFCSGKFVKIPGGLYTAFFEKVPLPICKTLEKLLRIHSLYCIGLRRKDNIYGSVTFAVRNDDDLNTNAIETIANQASMVLERMESFKKLQKMNKTLEEEVEKRTATIQKLLKQKDEFINQLGHDLKNPLGPFINLIPILQKQEQDPKRKEMLDVLSRNVGYMTNLVKKTIALAQLNSPNVSFHFEQVNLSTEIYNILKTNMTMLRKRNIEVHTNISDLLEISVDKLRFEELMTNLINNAIKYSKRDGGTLTIEAFDDDVNVTISVTDTGIGMEKDQIDHIFDEFYKADGSRHDFDSSGLGMPISRRIVEKHGGSIWAESDGLDKGSSFYIMLPKQQNNTDEIHSSVDI